MKNKLKSLAALISASLSNSLPATTGEDVTLGIIKTETKDEKLSVNVLNESVSKYLAAHRSHSSHRSHRSHRSSSSGSYRAPAAPSAPPQRQSDPLGQQPRQQESYPPANSTRPYVLNDPEKRKNIIMRVQLTLKFEGYYDGRIDGVMGPRTRDATLAYKRDKGIPGSTVLDAQTLNSLGIKGF